MRNNNNHNREYNGELDNSFDWQGADEWGDQEDMIHARKKHQDHRGRNKGQIRRNIDEINERQRLSEMLGEDFDNNLDLF